MKEWDLCKCFCAFNTVLFLKKILQLVLWNESRFELVKQNRLTKIYKRNNEKGLPKKFVGFVNYFMKNVKGSSNPFKCQYHKIVKHTQTIRRQIANELFKCV